jgi:glycosyltransferase involved in cell wall biosynthesis
MDCGEAASTDRRVAMTPTVSVVIPTHNRRTAVARLLRALAGQLPIDGGFEAIVVADGCTDGTADALAGVSWPFPLIVVEEPPSGAAQARNAGAERATGHLLLFLDDDVEPQPDVLRAHVSFHARCAGGVGIGDLPPRVVESGFFGTILRGWLIGMFDGPRARGHRYIYRNLLSGHFSIASDRFEAIGRFDPALRCHEDWELGYRAIEAGLELRFLPAAVAYHHDATTLAKTQRRRFDDGVADVQLIRRYPELAADLPPARPRQGGFVARALQRLAWRAPAVGNVVARTMRPLLRGYEAARLRYRWRALLEDLLDYEYWRGVALESGGREHLAALLARAPLPAAAEMSIDLARGIDHAKAQLDLYRPRSVRLLVSGVLVGDVPAAGGAERLRGEHLPRLIVRNFRVEYLRAAAQAGVLPVALQPAIVSDAAQLPAAKATDSVPFLAFS